MTIEEVMEKLCNNTLDPKEVTQEQLDIIREIIANLIKSRVYH